MHLDNHSSPIALRLSCAREDAADRVLLRAGRGGCLPGDDQDVEGRRTARRQCQVATAGDVARRRAGEAGRLEASNLEKACVRRAQSLTFSV